jgi:hypothetical protein
MSLSNRVDGTNNNANVYGTSSHRASFIIVVYHPPSINLPSLPRNYSLWIDIQKKQKRNYREKKNPSPFVAVFPE